MKTCSRCKTDKPFSDFGKQAKSKDGYQYHCRQCKAELHQLNHKRRMESIKRSQRKRVDTGRQFVVEWFSTHPCVDCGNSDIRVLEFDHLSDKLKGVGWLLHAGYSVAAIKREIEKCEVRCKNCHVIKTYERMGSTWHDKYMPLLTDSDRNLLNS